MSLAVASLLPDYALQPENGVLADQSPVPYATAFPAAGYAQIVVNDSYVGGAVRQYGNLSFSRIYDAGHMVPYYQPETAFTVFTRIIQGAEISTGDMVDLSTFGSQGTQNATHTNSVPDTPSSTCWVRSWNASCTDDDTEAMLSGKGTVANGIFYQDDSSISLPSTSVAAGVPGRPTTSTSESSQPSPHTGTSTTTDLTGVYTATNTPTSTKGSAPSLRPTITSWQPGAVIVAVFGLVLGMVLL